MKTTQILASAIAALACASTIQAASIIGSINFSSAAGGYVTLQDSNGFATNNLAAATGVKSWNFSETNADSGSFLSVPGGQSVSFNPSWDFSTAAPINPLWTITGGNNFSFKLLSSTILLRNSNFLFVSSTGILSSPNFADTPATWSFSTQGGAKDGKFGWSSVATAVPEPGTPAILCVILSGACLVRRRKTI